MTTESGENLNHEDLAEQLKKLSADERRKLLEEVETDDKLPILRWSSNPEAVKAAFKFVERKDTVTFEELRSYLQSEGHIDAEEGSYNFGIVDTDDGAFFSTTGDRDPNTEISLTDTGREFAAVFDENPGLRPIERTLLIGMQPYGSAFFYLSTLEAYREDGGLLREELQEALVDEYEGSGKYYTGYYNSWFHKLGLVEKEKIGRKVKYQLATPSGW
ncbi:hypothetical protein C491_20961 [Natronococcus amylolyticus DSM 10524]|uniref:Uncharacterized protein n=1 Tax=Natronococcus amylolyticus DSM 10524 TaxID=1227497 RepID=L9WW18_9EURY|nr:hypothetical protein [Natronococcus amylolyticus]ELY53650.1 hypothetical protein C491_20961 [Natronococcus amylolyticus DSM 10524]